jgi:probable rRNA maturation factor
LIDLDDRVGFNVNMDFLKSIKSLYTKKALELIFTTDEEIKEMNLEFRGIDKATDVLSFPLDDDFLAGSIVISIDKVNSVADELKHTREQELILLFIHALLHIVGFDHEIDNGEMRSEEKSLIERFNLPNSLIIRNDIED